MELKILPDNNQIFVSYMSDLGVHVKKYYFLLRKVASDKGKTIGELTKSEIKTEFNRDSAFYSSKNWK